MGINTIGIRNTAFLSANQTRVTSVAFLSLTDLKIPIAKGGLIIARYHIIGLADFLNSGFRFIIQAPAGGVSYVVDYHGFQYVGAFETFTYADSLGTLYHPTLQTGPGAYTFINPGGPQADYLTLEINATIQNGNTAGNLDLQFSQAVAGANPSIVLSGSKVDWTILK